MENEMRKIYLNQTSGYTALIFAYCFWFILDKMFFSNKAAIFQHLYLSPTHFGDSYLFVSQQFHVSERTLNRYRNLFVKSFQVVSSALSQIKSILNLPEDFEIIRKK